MPNTLKYYALSFFTSKHVINKFLRNPFKLWKYEIRNTSFYYEKFVQGRHLIRAWIFHFEGKLHRRVQETRTCIYSCIQCGHKWASKLRPEAITSLVRSSWSLRAYIISVSPKMRNQCHILIHTVFLYYGYNTKLGISWNQT